MECTICNYVMNDLQTMNETSLEKWINTTCQNELFANSTCNVLTEDTSIIVRLFMDIVKTPGICEFLGVCSKYFVIGLFKK